MKKITVLGVTGSIGTQTVDVVKHHREEFEIIAMSAGRNIELLEKIMVSVHVRHICVQNKEDKEYLENKYKDCYFIMVKKVLLLLQPFLKLMLS